MNNTNVDIALITYQRSCDIVNYMERGTLSIHAWP